ncbi:carbohydrate ABC transporter permease [Stagnihabitans tardus]|uniref:ABC transporter permease subunit n=1 Tax=Stagnihabitans tardus TaxID=2699202 RepID=A0AAE4YB44_9RHOB|nr:sugar ABC transporter permease [Stagnihabitans tardus]NBZ89401.1 ABC transporter permease subunit [Stagnihabitans tardus]
MRKVQNNGAWLLVLPVFLLVAFSAVIPLMTVVNYAFNDSFGENEFFWNGFDWFKEVIDSDRIRGALWRQFLFSAIVLLIEIPLGIAIALTLPKRGFWASLVLVLLAMPLVIPWNVVGTIWQVFARGDIGLLGVVITSFWADFNIGRDPLSAWIVVVMMDVWHWTSLVVLLAYAGLQAIPEAYYQAGRIDQASRWAIFRFIELPKLKGVLLIAVLLRFMDSFMIYTEPFVVTGGGPGQATTFLSIDLVKTALGQFDLGPAAAFSLMYFLVVLLMSWVFYTVMTAMDVEGGTQ